MRDNQKFVPLFYFEGETENLKLKADSLSGWDLSYLKFCCKVQGIRNELFASDQVAVISLTDIKSYFPPGIEFEDYWPSKVVDSQLLITKNGANGANGSGSLNNGAHWTRQPTQPPPKATPTAAANKPSVSAMPAMNTHAMYAAAQQLPVNSQLGVVASMTQQQRAKQQQQQNVAMTNNIVYNNVANGGRGVNLPMMAAAAATGRNASQLEARMLQNVWNLSPQEYQLRMAESNAYASNTLQNFNYNMLRAMQGSNGSAAGAAAGQGVTPAALRGAGGQGGNARNGNGQHL